MRGHAIRFAGMDVSRAGFASLAKRVLDLAGRKRFVAVLEGGYDRNALPG